MKKEVKTGYSMAKMMFGSESEKTNKHTNCPYIQRSSRRISEVFTMLWKVEGTSSGSLGLAYSSWSGSACSF